MFCTEAMADVVIGNRLARKIRKMGAMSDTPNHRMATGIQAIGEIGRSTWMAGLKARMAGVNQPRSRPKGIPTKTASRKPLATRNSDATMYLTSTPFWASSTRPATTMSGVGKMSLPVIWTAKCQPITKTTATSSGRPMDRARSFIPSPPIQFKRVTSGTTEFASTNWKCEAPRKAGQEAWRPAGGPAGSELYVFDEKRRELNLLGHQIAGHLGRQDELPAPLVGRRHQQEVEGVDLAGEAVADVEDGVGSHGKAAEDSALRAHGHLDERVRRLGAGEHRHLGNPLPEEELPDLVRDLRRLVWPAGNRGEVRISALGFDALRRSGLHRIALRPGKLRSPLRDDVGEPGLGRDGLRAVRRRRRLLEDDGVAAVVRLVGRVGALDVDLPRVDEGLCAVRQQDISAGPLDPVLPLRLDGRSILQIDGIGGQRAGREERHQGGETHTAEDVRASHCFSFVELPDMIP